MSPANCKQSWNTLNYDHEITPKHINICIADELPIERRKAMFYRWAENIADNIGAACVNLPPKRHFSLGQIHQPSDNSKVLMFMESIGIVARPTVHLLNRYLL